MLTVLEHRSWMYQEGKNREVFVLETSAPFLDVLYDPDQLETVAEQIAYVRGYFDAEGGIPQTPHLRFYIQFTQKNEVELGKVKAILKSLGLLCGKLHNPSSRVDPIIGGSTFERSLIETLPESSALGIHERKQFCKG